jgi:predicted SnoaL-like aldol condensation-catalyzing enzyme
VNGTPGGSALSWQIVMGARKDAAVSFLRLAASGRVREAYANHAGAAFRHHNPFFAGDAQALMAGMEENARQNPTKQLDILRALEDGDLVAVHSRVRQNQADRGAALVHIFRFEGDRIAELWDIGQPVPAESVNANGMF